MTEDRTGGGTERTRPGDDDLRADFHALRGEMRSAGRIPDFDEMLAGARTEASTEEPAPSRRRVTFPGVGVWLPVAAAATIATVLLVGGPGSDPDATFEEAVADYSRTAASGAFRSPTEALMDIPGVDLGAVPSFTRSWDREDVDGSADGEGRDS